MNNSKRHAIALAASAAGERIIADRLHAAGYRTAAIGKWPTQMVY